MTPWRVESSVLSSCPPVKTIKSHEPIMRILIVGAGSTGGYFGGRLLEAGRDVTFLARGKRTESLRGHGLRIVSPLGNVTIKPRVLTAATLNETFDLVVVSVKSYSLASAIGAMAPAVGHHTMVMPLLNGMAHVPALAARFGEESLIGGYCKIAGTLDKDGCVVQLSPMHELVYGERDGSRSNRVQAIDACMQPALFDSRLSGRIMEEMWEKWLMLSTLCGITCLMRGSVGDVVDVPGGKDFANALFDEAVAVVTAASHTPSLSFIDAMRQQMTQEGSSFTSSMLRDLLQGLSVEAWQIIGDFVLYAARYGVKVPLLRAAYASLAVYQKKTGQVEGPEHVAVLPRHCGSVV